MAPARRVIQCARARAPAPGAPGAARTSHVRLCYHGNSLHIQLTLTIGSRSGCTDMASAGASGHSTVTPSSNRLLQRKWDEQRFHAHKQRVSRCVQLPLRNSDPLSVLQLRAMKSSVDNGAPRQFTHIRQNARKHRVCWYKSIAPCFIVFTDCVYVVIAG